MGSWIFGPQLAGLVFFIIGLLTLCFPPRHINRFYGYRLPSAMKNQQTWDEANRFAPRYMLKSGLWIFIIGMVCSLLMRTIPMAFDVKEVLTVFLFILSAMVPAVCSIIATEKHLKKKFDNKQE